MTNLPFDGGFRSGTRVYGARITALLVMWTGSAITLFAAVMVGERHPGVASAGYLVVTLVLVLTFGPRVISSQPPGIFVHPLVSMRRQAHSDRLILEIDAVCKKGGAAELTFRRHGLRRRHTVRGLIIDPDVGTRYGPAVHLQLSTQEVLLPYVVIESVEPIRTTSVTTPPRPRTRRPDGRRARVIDLTEAEQLAESVPQRRTRL